MSKDKIPISISKSSSTSFTLVELIIVIIVVGILAAVGISQYSKTVEKSRGAEARQILGQIRKLAYEYYLQNGTVTGIGNNDLNLGTGLDQIPSACRSTHYFRYATAGATSDPYFQACAIRCTADGKTPQAAAGTTLRLDLGTNFATGVDTWINSGGASY